ncbi:MAG TPA: molybdenum cofactor guanylyltransferase [Solirubrobacteraceae bacterium]
MSAAGPAPIGVVLAGGASRRMGAAKPGVELAGRPLLSYPLAALRAALAEVAVIAKAHTPLPAVGYGVLIWREPDEPRHPLAGIVAALGAAGGRAIVVLACDMPFVTPDLVRALAGAETRAPVVVARAEGRIQPLAARYEPRALGLLQGFDPAGRTIEQVAALAPLALDVDPELLANVNRPEDLAAARAALSRT